MGESTKNSSQEEPPPPTYSLVRETFALIFYALGIYAIYLAYGMLHESIYHSSYGENGDKFTFSLLLVGLQSIVNGLFAAVNLQLAQDVKSDTTPKLAYAKISFTYLFAMFASNWALTFVTYPVQVLVKSVKIIPVMLMRIIVNGKRYSLAEYLCVLLTTIGIMVFVFKPKKNDAEYNATQTYIGYGLCALSLILDAYTGPNQEKIVEEHKPNVNQLMMSMNIFGVFYAFVGLVLTSQLIPSIQFVMLYPEVLYKIIAFSSLSAFGQFLILKTVFRFNSLVLTTVTTTRKFFTILISIVWNNHAMSNSQYLGIALVFLGLSMNVVTKYRQVKRAEAQKHI